MIFPQSKAKISKYQLVSGSILTPRYPALTKSGNNVTNSLSLTTRCAANQTPNESLYTNFPTVSSILGSITIAPFCVSIRHTTLPSPSLTMSVFALSVSAGEQARQLLHIDRKFATFGTSENSRKQFTSCSVVFSFFTTGLTSSTSSSSRRCFFSPSAASSTAPASSGKLRIAFEPQSLKAAHSRPALSTHACSGRESRRRTFPKAVGGLLCSASSPTGSPTIPQAGWDPVSQIGSTRSSWERDLQRRFPI
ncbi:hypothetical protein VIGAN_11262000 [Vigna angularis var. angularis]|uniref:Uncharacterized protein n=1 Tax=Vigna angularis var. angularis TaxID=157739 RepID=A0A0S3TCZ0_PHAAN|nr:hypothetical protein VIGAN_11262000 [Vigna angularis var. angularis]